MTSQAINITQINLFKELTFLTARRVLKRRSTLAFLAVGLFPCLIAIFWLLCQFYPAMKPASKPYAIFEYVHLTYYLSFYVPLLALFLGLGTISDEIETKNITFTLTRPLHRSTIAFGRVAGHVLAAVTLVCISLTSGYVANMMFHIEDFISRLPNLFNGLLVLSFGVSAYLAIVALMGTLLKRFAILLALVWILMDLVFSLFPLGILKHISIRHRILASYWDSLPQFLPSLGPIHPGNLAFNLMIFVGIILVCGFLMGLRLNRELILTDASK